MSLFVARNISLLLMLAAFPLISIGTTRGPAALWWLGLASLVIGALIPPVLRFVPAREERPRPSATDLGESCRVC